MHICVSTDTTGGSLLCLFLTGSPTECGIQCVSARVAQEQTLAILPTHFEAIPWLQESSSMSGLLCVGWRYYLIRSDKLMTEGLVCV